MSSKTVIFHRMTEEFNKWENLLSRFDTNSCSQIVYENMTVKDILAHVMAWQQVSIARLEAGIEGREPIFPDWFTGEPDSDLETNQVNSIIYEEHRNKEWEKIYKRWKDGFLRFIDLGEKISENDMFNTKKYAWLDGHSLFIVLDHSIQHHKEHRDLLRFP